MTDVAAELNMGPKATEARDTDQATEILNAGQARRDWRRKIGKAFLWTGAGVLALAFGPAILGAIGGGIATATGAIGSAALAAGATAEAVATTAAIGTAMGSILTGLSPIITAGGAAVALGGLGYAAGGGIASAARPRS